MNSQIKYKKYFAKIEYDPEDEIYFGVVNNIADSITFEGKTEKEVKQAFHDAVDQYLKFCKEVGKCAACRKE